MLIGICTIINTYYFGGFYFADKFGDCFNDVRSTKDLCIMIKICGFTLPILLFLCLYYESYAVFISCFFYYIVTMILGYNCIFYENKIIRKFIKNRNPNHIMVMNLKRIIRAGSIYFWNGIILSIFYLMLTVKL